MMCRRKGDQTSLFYEFRLDDRMPKDHLLRGIDIFVTAALADIHEQLEHFTEVSHLASTHDSDEDLCRMRHGSPSCGEDRLGLPSNPRNHSVGRATSASSAAIRSYRPVMIA
jgi:hypothetical protein